jgi:hypothetical protein
MGRPDVGGLQRDRGLLGVAVVQKDSAADETGENQDANDGNQGAHGSKVS